MKLSIKKKRNLRIATILSCFVLILFALPNGNTSRSGAHRCHNTLILDTILQVVKPAVGESIIPQYAPTNLSKSQNKEDLILLDFFFRGMCGGTYLELGGLDGVHLSNSHLFHHTFGWRGVLIEPNPISFRALWVNRPRDELFNYAVCNRSSKVHFLTGNQEVTGVLEFMSPTFIKLWHENPNMSALPQIDCSPLSAILEQTVTGKSHIDFLSVDVEGAEFEVMKTIDFNKHHFGVIFYEAYHHNPEKNEKTKSLLIQNGYPFHFNAAGSNFHVNSHWKETYGFLRE